MIVLVWVCAAFLIVPPHHSSHHAHTYMYWYLSPHPTFLSIRTQVEDINLVRDDDTGKSKGFAFLKYEDSRSCILAVDNLTGSKVRHMLCAGPTICCCQFVLAFPCSKCLHLYIDAPTCTVLTIYSTTGAWSVHSG